MNTFTCRVMVLKHLNCGGIIRQCTGIVISAFLCNKFECSWFSNLSPSKKDKLCKNQCCNFFNSLPLGTVMGVRKRRERVKVMRLSLYSTTNDLRNGWQRIPLHYCLSKTKTKLYRELKRLNAQRILVCHHNIIYCNSSLPKPFRGPNCLKNNIYPEKVQCY